jgi:putative addiction module component (TIGR02574 family)
MTQLEIADLPLRDKLHLMESLWDALCHEAAGEPDMPPWHKEVLNERLARLDAGQEPVTSWDEAKQRIRAKVKQG